MMHNRKEISTSIIKSKTKKKYLHHSIASTTNQIKAKKKQKSIQHQTNQKKNKMKLNVSSTCAIVRRLAHAKQPFMQQNKKKKSKKQIQK